MTTIIEDHRKTAREFLRGYGLAGRSIENPETMELDLAHMLAERDEMVRERWRPIAEYKDEMNFVLAGLWVHNDPLNVDVFEVYKAAPRECDDCAIDEYGDIITEWSWSLFTHFMPLPAPPEPTTTDAGGE